jgi:hypothetical protein
MNSQDERVKNFYENDYHRQVDVGRYVNVHQSKSFTRDDVWEPAKVSWASIGSVDHKQAVEFAGCVFEASRIAEKWTKEKVKS